MRERRYLTFDMENPRHREAFALFSAQSGKLRSEYVVDCILQAQYENHLVETMRKVLKEAFKDITLAVPRHRENNDRFTDDGEPIRSSGRVVILTGRDMNHDGACF